MEQKKLQHLEEAIDQLGAFAEGEQDKNRQLWLNDILNSLKKVFLDLESVYVVTRSEEHCDYVEDVFLSQEAAESYCASINAGDDNYHRDITKVALWQ